MRKVILTILLAIMSSSAEAQWVDWFVPKGNTAQWVAADSNEAVTIYADTATLRRAGHMAQMWDLTDMQAGRVLGGGKRSMSFKKEQEYNCNTQEARILYISWHSGNMGTGDIIGSDHAPGSWRPVLLGTIVERMWKLACGK